MKLRGAELDRAMNVVVLRPEAQITGPAAHAARVAHQNGSPARWTRPVEPTVQRVVPGWLRAIEIKEARRRERLRLWRAAGAQAPPKVKPWMKPPRGLAERQQADPRLQGDAKPPKHNYFAQSDPRWRQLPDVTLESPAPSGPYGDSKWIKRHP